MNQELLKELRIGAEAKARPRRVWIIFVLIIALTSAAVYYAWPRASDSQRVGGTLKPYKRANSNSAQHASAAKPAPEETSQSAPTPASPSDAVLTVSGYIVNRERIELSPRFMGLVKWVGVKKGDSVTNGQVVVLLDDSEYAARLKEAEARLASARVAEERARLHYERISRLSKDNVESRHMEDEARLNLASARAVEAEVEGQIALIRTYLDWTVIRSPISGVVLEKLADPNELVTPQSFGGTRGPSTALLAVADPNDLQVEIDLNEADLPKVSLNQECRVSPEAYPDRHYQGHVAEIAPEASRQKGTLQIKVQIRSPDKYLTPELSAKVEFLDGASSRNAK